MRYVCVLFLTFFLNLSYAAEYVMPTKWEEIDDGKSLFSYTFALDLTYENNRIILKYEDGIDPLIYLINSPLGEIGVSLYFVNPKCHENPTMDDMKNDLIYFHEKWIKTMKYCKEGKMVYTPYTDAGQKYITTTLKKAKNFVHFKINDAIYGVTAIGFTKAYNKMDKRLNKLKTAL